MISKETAPHYNWGAGCDGWHLVKQPDLGVIQERMPAKASEQRHYHLKARQFFFVLSGIARFELEGQLFELGPGQGIEVAAGQTHCIHNPGPQDLAFLVVSQPHAHGDRVAVG